MSWLCFVKLNQKPSAELCFVKQADKALLRNYIPGLHRPGENYPVLPENPNLYNQPKPIPPELISEYKKGTKNPVCLHLICHYCCLNICPNLVVGNFLLSFKSSFTTKWWRSYLHLPQIERRPLSSQRIMIHWYCYCLDLVWTLSIGYDSCQAVLSS